jgi:phage gpG-like protein
MARVVLRIEIEGEAQLAHTLEGVSAAISDLSETWKDVANNIIYPSIALNFASQGRPEGWEGLRPKYAKRKMREVGPRPILEYNGLLVSTMIAVGPGGGKIEEVNPESLIIGIERAGPIFYGIFHTSRGERESNLPRRQFLMLQPEDTEAIIKRVQERIMGQIGY